LGGQFRFQIWNFLRFSLGIGLICSYLLPIETSAQSIREIVTYSLEASPALKAERLRLEALDEQRIQALNLRRPIGQIEAGTSIATSAQGVDGYESWKRTEPGSASISFTQPILLGGRFQASLREADLRIAQGLARVRALELSTVRDAVEAYGDVVRDHYILQIRQEGVFNLSDQLAGTKARYTAGLVGLTELSQAQSRLAAARGQEAVAQARLTTSWANLERLIDRVPSGLVEMEIGLGPTTVPGDRFFEGPPSLPNAIDVALRLSHDLKVARFVEEIARATARVSQAETAPRANLQAVVSGIGDARFNGSRSINADFKASIVIPIWSGGQPQSRVRAALANANAARLDSLELEQKLKERVTSAWANAIAARQSVESASEQVRASVAALTGARLEQKIGVRSVLEVLNQEQEVLEAKISLASARRDVLVNQAILLTLIGLDPTRVVTSETEFDLDRSPRSVFGRSAGQTQRWEKPGVVAHDILLAIDPSLTRGIHNAKQVVLGPEE
jgi:outer membrane protein